MGSFRFRRGCYGAEVDEANSLFRSAYATFPYGRPGFRACQQRGWWLQVASHVRAHVPPL